MATENSWTVSNACVTCLHWLLPCRHAHSAVYHDRRAQAYETVLCRLAWFVMDCATEKPSTVEPSDCCLQTFLTVHKEANNIVKTEEEIFDVWPMNNAAQNLEHTVQSVTNYCKQINEITHSNRVCFEKLIVSWGGRGNRGVETTT